jgi:hypothetical protein
MDVKSREFDYFHNYSIAEFNRLFGLDDLNGNLSGSAGFKIVNDLSQFRSFAVHQHVYPEDPDS